MKKEAFVVLCLILFMLSLSGCDKNIVPTKEEIDNFEVIQIIGIDQSADDPSNVEVSLITQHESVTNRETRGGTKTHNIISASGPTVFETQRKLKARSNRVLYFGYVDYFLIGEEAAKDDFGKYMDYISRNENIRYTPKVYIIRGCSAKDFINQTTSQDKYLGDWLENVAEDIDLLSNFKELKVLDVINMLDHQDVSAGIVPVIKCAEIENESIVGGELPERDASTSGYGVIKDFKLTGYIEEEYSRGYNFLVDKVQSAPVTVEDFSGQNVALEVLYEKTKVQAQFNGDTLEAVTYKTTVEANIAEQLSRANIWTHSEIVNLGTKLSEIIKGEMAQVIAKSKEFQIDCTDLGEQIRMRYPYKWEKIKDQWREIYPNLDIRIDVDSRLRRSYDIREPNGVETGS